MTSRSAQPESFDDTTTTSYYDEEDVHVDLTIEDSVINDNETLSTSFYNAPCGSDCYMVGKPHAPPPASNFSTEVIVSLVMLVLVITICVIIAFRHIKHSQKQQRRGRIQNERAHALPFEEVAIMGDEHDVIELRDIGSTPIATPTGTTTN